MSGVFCSKCGTQIAVHADATAMCSCDSIEFDTMPSVEGIKNTFGITDEEAQYIFQLMCSEHQYR